MSSKLPLVYVVDDEPSVRRSLARLLRSLGLESREFASGPELLAHDQRAEAASLVVDIHMPRMSGYDLVENLAAAGLSIPVIFITARAEEVDRWQEKPSAAVALLIKPFSEGELVAALERALGRELAPGTLA